MTTTTDKLLALALELAGEALDHDRRRLREQAHVRRETVRAGMRQADSIQGEVRPAAMPWQHPPEDGSRRRQ